MKQAIVLACIFFALSCINNTVPAQSSTGYHVSNTFHIASSGGWDYPAADPASNKLYLSHGTQVNILNKETGDSLGIIFNTTGVHGIAFVNSLGKDIQRTQSFLLNSKSFIR